MTEKEEQLYNERLKKLQGLKESGQNPFPASTTRTHRIADVIENFDNLTLPSPRQERGVVLAGRVRAIRGHGAIMFGTLDDGSGTIQFILKKEETPPASAPAFAKGYGGRSKATGGQADLLEWFDKFIDIGDFIEIGGSLMTTQRGEKSLLVHSLKILTKSLRALPDKWHGLTDEEQRLRKRYLDLISNSETRELFRKKAIFWQTLRTFMIEKGFLEVWTPVLENIPGGADAQPFVTHHNALDRDFFLRISLELPLKRLLVGGYEKVFEIGRLFRNEGIDREHLQEYDDMEFYWAYADHEDGMKLVEELFKAIVAQVAPSMETEYGSEKINWAGKWERVEYFDAFKNETGLDLNFASLVDLRDKAIDLKVEIDKKLGRARLIDAIYKKTVRPKLIQPCFLVGHPLDISPLAKLDPENPKKVLRFQVLAGGTELGNAWAELNDPIDQKERFEQQMKLREAGDKEAQMLDQDFVEALEYGMPPAVGFGVSERLFAVLMNRSMRETVIFPPMREAK